jgi:hypothetical protein
VNPVTVLITVDNECMILEILMIRNRNITLSSASLNPKKVDVVFNIDKKEDGDRGGMLF